MPSIMFVNQKGGVGKSTISINTAVHLAKKKSVSILDTDPQASILSFLQMRESNNLSTKNLDFKSPTLKYLERELKAIKSEYTIIDTQGQGSSDVIANLSLVDLAIIPIQPSLMDIEATRDLISKILTLIQGGKTINYKILINGALTNSKSTTTDLKIFLKENNMNYFESVISFRKIYKDSLFEGKGILEITDDKPATKNAKDEFLAFIKELLNIIENKTTKGD